MLKALRVFPTPSTDNDSWISYWESHKRLQCIDGRYECPACNQLVAKHRFVGAHVQKVNSADRKWYIIPICRPCNNRTDDFEVNENYLLKVPSNLNY
jgi:hypothetical protein